MAAVLAATGCRAGPDTRAGRCEAPDRLGAGPVDLARRAPPGGRGRVLHVAPAGSDAADCSAGAPCRQIARAVSRLAAGDTLVIEPGDYDRFTMSAAGRAGAPITLYARAPGATVRGQPGCGRRDRSCRDAILIERAAYVVLDGLGATGAARAGLAVENSRQVTVRNGVFADNGRWGIFSGFVDDLVVEHNEAARSVHEHGIYASNSGDRPIIRRNWVHDNRACGIQINADWTVKDPDHLYPGVVDGITTGAVVEGNVISGNGRGGGAAINLDGVQDSLVRNNLLFANTASGIVCYGDADGVPDMSQDDGDGRQGPRGMVIVHNTVVQPPGARAALLIRHAVGRNQVRNNILYHADPRGPAIRLGSDQDAADLDSDHNAFSRPGAIDLRAVPTSAGPPDSSAVIDLEAWRARGEDRHSLAATADALFAAPGCDFSPARGSPARDRGAAMAGSGDADLRGQPRPRGPAPDLGALEAAPP